MRCHLFRLALLLCALALYALGLDGGGALLFMAGGVCELWFWVRGLRGNRHRAARTPGS